MASLLGAADPSQRYIFLRGVSWRSADLDALRVWQGLMRALPTPFLPHLTSPPELLVAHRQGPPPAAGPASPRASLETRAA